jgi:hypothetical protein
VGLRSVQSATIKALRFLCIEVGAVSAAALLVLWLHATVFHASANTAAFSAHTERCAEEAVRCCSRGCCAGAFSVCADRSQGLLRSHRAFAFLQSRQAWAKRTVESLTRERICTL